jgi:hypothetical protein
LSLTQAAPIGKPPDSARNAKSPAKKHELSGRASSCCVKNGATPEMGFESSVAVRRRRATKIHGPRLLATGLLPAHDENFEKRLECSDTSL